VDASGNAYLAGDTNSSDFPLVAGAFQATLHGPTNGFVTKLNPTASGLLYSSYLGGGADDAAASIAVDGSGFAYVTGVTTSSNFPTTAGAFQGTLRGSQNVFVTRIDGLASGPPATPTNTPTVIPTSTPTPRTPVIVPLPSPVRLADTRSSGGLIQTGSSRCFSVAGVGGIPADAGVVVLNVTADGQTTNGWLTAYPNGQPVPPTSTLNFGTVQYAMANGVIMRVGTGGQVCVNVGTVNSVPGGSQVVLDATGFVLGNALSELSTLPSPARLSDTRTSGGPIQTGASRCYQVAGTSGIPVDAVAVMLNVTAVGYGTDGWLTAYPNGQSVPARPQSTSTGPRTPWPITASCGSAPAVRFV
jgi:hypothetical protein